MKNIGNNSYTAYVISNKPEKFNLIKESINPVQLNFFDGSNCGSFSKLVNTCVEQCSTEIVIMMSDKVLPKKEHIDKILNLLNLGYAFVGLYRFAFFGFKKELFRKIGPLDERFSSGGYEDDDFYIRLKEADLAVYLTEEVPYNKSNSSWNYHLSRPHFINKWIPYIDPNIKFHNNKTERQMPEEKYDYNWGESQTTNFLPWANSHITTSKGRKYIKSYKIQEKI